MVFGSDQTLPHRGHILAHALNPFLAVFRLSRPTENGQKQPVDRAMANQKLCLVYCRN